MILYIIEGLVIGGSNLIIVITVVRFQALRNNKGYLILMGLSFADTCNMSGYALAGMYISVTGQINGYFRTAAGRRPDRYVAMIRIDYCPANSKPQPRALTNGFCRVKGFENMLEVRLFYADAIILDGYVNAIVWI